ncbi:hypothetical protein Aduo_013850 [Ancylostoma duodenale]
MSKLYFNALAIISLLPALCEGVLPLCPNGAIDKETVDRDILQTVNDRRQTLTEGRQKNGDTGQNLPPAKGMTKVRWSCELEQIANNAMGDTCQPQQRANSRGLADFFHHDYDPEYYYWAGKILQNALNAHLVQIDLFPLHVPTHANKVIYNGDEQLKTYANLVRPTNTEIGCAINRCFGFGENSKMGDGAAMYCLLNSRSVVRRIYFSNITNGETIYEVA